jgi:hypothetical protein
LYFNGEISFIFLNCRLKTLNRKMNPLRMKHLRKSRVIQTKRHRKMAEPHSSAAQAGFFSSEERWQMFKDAERSACKRKLYGVHAIHEQITEN